MKTEYTDSQYSSNYPDGVQYHWWNLARNDFIARLLQSLPTTRQCVLEVGCGRGIVVDYLRRRGVDCDGIELAEVTPVAGVADHITSGASAFDLPIEAKSKYNIIMALDVLEHLPTPEEFLRDLVESFPGVTEVIITVPARPELWSNYDEHYGHFRRYTKQGLEELVLASGASPSTCGYFFHGVYPVALVGSLLKKDRGINIPSPKGWRRLAHKLVSGVLALDARWLPRSLPGTSAYAVCHVDRAKGMAGADVPVEE